MNSEAIKAFLESHVTFFAGGDLEDMLAFYRPPLAVYFREQMLVFSTPSELHENVEDRRATYRQAGILGITPTLGAVELVRNNQFRIWASWDYRFTDRVEKAASEIVYYCRLTDAGFAVQMVQTTRSYMQEIGEVTEPQVSLKPAAS